MATEYMIEVEGLKQHFRINRDHTVKAVDGVSFKVEKGTTFGLVGESGSGKSTIGRTMIGLYEATAGSVKLGGTEIVQNRTNQTRRYVTNTMQMIFQDPMASLNPRKKVIDIIAEGLDANKLYKTKAQREQMVYDILERVGLNADHANRYPHMFSGGQRQRIGIARAVVMNPSVIIADECISALDVSIQAQVVNIMKELQKERNLTYLFIAHDLAMVKYISDYIGVIHLGHFVEMGKKDEIFNNPIHPYTKSLLSAIPEPNPITEPHRNAETYDKVALGIQYDQGQQNYITDTHMVLATPEELATWQSQTAPSV